MKISHHRAIQGVFIHVANKEIGTVTAGLVCLLVISIPLNVGITGFEDQSSPTVKYFYIDITYRCVTGKRNEEIILAIIVWCENVWQGINRAESIIDADDVARVAAVSNRVNS